MTTISPIVFYRQLVAALDEFQLEEVRNLVNVANRVRDRIFPGDRLNPTSLKEEYLDAELVSLRIQGELVGCILLRDHGEGIHLNLLAILPKFQGHGLGSRLIEHAILNAAEKGVRVIELDAVDTGSLVNYYLSLGFQEKSRELMPAGKWSAREPFELVTLRRIVSSRAQTR